MATENDGMLIGRGSIRRVFDSTREIETTKGISRRASGTNRDHVVQIVEGMLLEDLDAATDPDTPTSAQFLIKTSLQASDSWVSAPTPNEVTVKNRLTAAFSASDVAFAAELYPNKWFIIGSGGSTSSGSTTCPCNCIPAGDVLVGGIETTMHWIVKMSTETFQQEFGSIRFPGGEYLLVKDTGADQWTLDIGDFLTAQYASGVDATAETTMSGTLTMAFDVYGGLYVSLCVDGTVPEEV